MKGIIVNYRRGRHTQHPRQYIIEVEGIDSKQEATKLLGKKVEWKTPSGKILRGKLISTHGNKGRLRAKFRKGLPGQALGTKVEII